MSHNKISWNFDNSYTKLPENFYTRIAPTKVASPQLVIVNDALADDLGLQLRQPPKEDLAQLFSGNALPEGAEPIAQAYAGHQFGHFAMLGDGRAHLIGEHITLDGKRLDIQLKGSGRTPYARRGDGRAALGPMLREYIISEAMHALNIPTTRSLAVITTGEPVLRETALQGAILTRVAASHIRVGTFEYVANTGDKAAMKQLADYIIERHYPEIADSERPYLDFLQHVMDRQIILINEWLRVGFIHGVMNTDNMAISGETIDYGPCAFMDAYDPQTVFSSIDHMGRYAYDNQPVIVKWNLSRLAEAMLPLFHQDEKQALSLAEGVLNHFNAKFQQQWLTVMRKKLGLLSEEKEDERLIGGLLQWMQRADADYTNTFRNLCSEKLPEGKLYQDGNFKQWYQRWQKRVERNQQPLTVSLEVMKNNNPNFIPRNHRVEEALQAAGEDADFSVFKKLMEVIANPYQDNSLYSEYKNPPKPEERIYQTFCGT